MSGAELTDLWRGALTVAATVAAPFVLAALLVGLLVAVVQTATQLQESVLVFAPKLASALLVLIVAGPWFLDQLQRYALLAFAAAAGAAP
jgi:flagellar biosynthesis protein FliQ